MREGLALGPAMYDAYGLALSDIPEHRLERAFLACSRECEWFPSAAEIRAKAAPTEAERDEALQQLADRQRQAPKPKLLKSVLDPEQADTVADVRRAAGIVPLGEGPLVQIDPARVEFLRKQAAMLGARDWRKETAGMTAGMIG